MRGATMGQSRTGLPGPDYPENGHDIGRIDADEMSASELRGVSREPRSEAGRATLITIATLGDGIRELVHS
ncbi:hypothetical protein [Halorhabdus amylolytica]|uniref:hypothetical protein n=1 Tax=Halorhabdus amylolytica TaxID=2559573 RepID=UPI001B7D8AB3|nr:hypothetical protein [Halorhabdus amylolytica]